MKIKLLQILVAGFAIAGTCSAQVATLYTFTQVAGTYSAITGGTLVGSTTSDDQTFVDPTAPLGSGATGPGYDIGFTFKFNDQKFNRIGINNNGWIGFGRSSLSPAVDISNTGSNYNVISSTSGALAVYQNRVAGLSRDIQAQTGSTLRVQTIGAAPTRTCVIQFENYRKFGATGDVFNFQIRLMETTNIVEIMYGTFTNNATAGTAEVGIRGNSNLDYSNRITTSTDPWAASIPGTANTSVVNYNNAGLVPASGQIYRWSPAQCSGVLSNLSAIAAPTLVCPNSSSDIQVLGTSTLSGLTYTWYASDLSGVGTWTLVSGASGELYTTPPINVTMWYQAVVGCLSSASTATSSSAQVKVAAPTSSTVPYFEDFEGVQAVNRLPNCSWFAAGLGTSFQTYLAPNTGNRVPLSGTKFGAFVAPTNTNYVFTNGIQMEPGITYSAAVNFATEYTGANNWTNLSLMVASAQLPATATNIATAAPAISGPYKLLSNTFTVPSSGLYYIAVRATGIAGTAQYLMIDDISVTIPCTPLSGNIPTISLVASSNTVCQNDIVSLTANGGQTYTWSSTSDPGPIYSPTLSTPGTFTFYVTGTNTLTGCSGVASEIINVLPAPAVNGNAQPALVCKGGKVILSANGAVSYAWSNGGSGPIITATTVVSNTYQVIGTGANGCKSSVDIPVSVMPNPTVTAFASVPTLCMGESVTLSANGANTYMWSSSGSPAVLQGATVTIYPQTPATYIVTGTDVNGCQGSFQLNVSVETCPGFAEHNPAGNFEVYPNPASDKVTLRFNSEAARTVALFDLNGKLLQENSVSGLQHEFALTNQLPGVYFIRVSDNSGTRNVKVVKQ